jgi:hypothetical protein
MNHPQLTAMIATQHDLELRRRADSARRVKQDPHGIRVLKCTPAPQAKRSVWSKIASAGRTATITPAPECKLA